MQVCDCATLGDYHAYLREHPIEISHLLRDFLISVTNFFRDPDAFSALADSVIPRWFETKSDKDPLRIWVAGGATGEEAYSIGILLREHAARARVWPEIQSFATDSDERALAEARLGCYSEAIIADVSPERLQRIFTRENDQYRVCKELRELVLFSPHNVLRDPPFSRLDLESCRNLLIYLDRAAQQRVLSSIHFGLRPDAALLLGASESADASSLFNTVDAKQRLFSRRTGPTSLGDVVPPRLRWQLPVASAPSDVATERAPSLGELHYRAGENYAPPSVLVNPELEIVHISEHAGQFLQLAGGEPSRQLLRVVLPDLQLDLRAAIYAARQHGRDQRVVHYEKDGKPEAVELRVQPVNLPELGDELLRTRDQLRMTVEQYETSLEELKASNEELQAINEELRSATEELETSREELQSVNEELRTVNQELKVKGEEQAQAANDVQNLINSTDIGTVF